MPQLSIIIVNYNTYQYTVNCIRSIKSFVKQLEHEIILVDNASKECAPQKFLMEFPDIILIPLSENIGFGRGNNVGIRAAKASTLLLLNSDTLIFDDSIDKTFRFLHKQPFVGMVGCKLLNDDGTEQLSSFIHVRFPLLNLLINANPFLSALSRFLNVPSNYDHIRLTLKAQQKNHSCEALSGAFMMVKKEVIEQCGDFDPDFFMYCEDTEWCRNRIIKKFKIYYFTEASIIHLGGKSSTSVIVSKQTQLSSFLYNYKIGKITYCLVLAITLFNSICNLLALPMVKTETRVALTNQLKSLIAIVPYLLFDIPRYKRTYAGRPGMLIIDDYKKSN
jgi:GT2 family glycosyltransferase